jgi:cell wall-associated NlpC family hydrolase
MRWIDHYVGLPFVERGRTRAGLDCYGLVRLVMAERGDLALPAFDTIGSMDGPAVRDAIATAETSWLDVAVDDLQDFDVAVMRSHYQIGGAWRGTDMHLGILVSPTLLLHIEPETGSVCIPVSHPSVAERIRRYKRHPFFA